MKFKSLFLICAIGFLTSCTPKTKDFSDLFEAKTDISLHELKENYIDSLGKPNLILTLGDHSVFLEPSLKQFLSIYDRKQNKFSSILSKGQAAYEASNIQTIGRGRNDHEIYACDPISQQVFLISLDDYSIHKDLQEFPHRFCDIAYDKDLTFLMTVGTDKRFCLKSKEREIPFGKIIELEGLSPMVASNMLQGPCLLCPQQNRIVWFSAYGEIMEIYDYSDLNNIRLVRSHIISTPIYGNTNGAMSLDTKFSVISSTSDGEFIYALYNGKSLKEFAQSKESSFYSDRIMIFDWEGNPIQILHTDMLLNSISYDKNTESLHCLGLNEEYVFSVFSISKENLQKAL